MEIDRISPEDWRRALTEFRDANYFQTWEYGSTAWGVRNQSHAVLKKNGHIIAAAQVRITNILPAVKYAYVVDGPLWRRKDTADDHGVFDAMVRGLMHEYMHKQGCTLRIYPFVHDGDPAAAGVRSCLEQNGFTNNTEKPRTLFLDITAPREELRKNLRKQWRQYLRRAEESGLEVTVGTDRELFLACLAAYHSLHERKKFIENVRMEEFLDVHEQFPEQDKMTIIAVGKGKRIDACMIYTAMGDTGFPVLAATTRTGLENHASYLAYWEMLNHASGKGVRWFDFRGIDPEGNRGVYNFKTGVTGSRGLEVSFLGDFVLYHDILSRLAIYTAEQAKARLRSLAGLFRGLQRKQCATSGAGLRPVAGERQQS